MKGHITVSVSTQKTVYIEDDVDLTVEDFVEGLDDDGALELFQALAARVQIVPQTAPLMERLYLALARGGKDLTDAARDVLYEYGGRIA